MKILSRMYVTQNLKILLLTVLAVLSLSLLFEFFEVAKSAAKAGTSLMHVFRYLCYSAPRYMVFALPLGVLLSTMTVLGMSARRQELTAIRSLGGSLRRVSLVFLALGVLWSALTFLLSEYVVPQASRRAVHIQNVDIEKKESRLAHIREKIWLSTDTGGLAKIDVISGDQIRGLSVFEFDGAMKTRIEAVNGVWKDGAWLLRGVRMFTFKDGRTELERLETLKLTSLPGPDQLREEQRRPDEMSFRELQSYTRNLEVSGIRANKYRVTLYGKTSFPLVCLAMALLGAGLAIRDASAGGRFRTVALCTGVIVSYWGLHMLMLSMGYVGRIPPLASAWLTPAAFLSFGAYVFARSERLA